LEEQNSLPADKKGCHHGSKCFKYQFVISKEIHAYCKRRNKNLNIARIGYQKTFNSVPNIWVEKSI
jgi:hypothetical protein